MSPDGPPPTPELRECWLGRAELQALFEELRGEARVEQVRLRGAPGRRSHATSDLAQAERALLSGELGGAQLLYRVHGRGFCDTLLRQGERFRLVRAELPEPPLPRA